MRRSLSEPPVPGPAPRLGQLPEGSCERDRSPDEPLPPEQYPFYHRQIVRRANLILQSICDAEIVADQVMKELWDLDAPPTKAYLEAHLSTRIRWRTIDRLKSASHQREVGWDTLTGTNDEGETFEVFPQAAWSPSAEEEFFQGEERQRVRGLIAEALGHLKPLQRACFVLRLVERMQPEDIATLLDCTPELVHRETYRARNRIERLLAQQEEETITHEKRTLPSIAKSP
jgi:RNA polymerase sigma factor (sigma-70 family)